ncbi:MAG: hypothetical protein HY314_17315 [Acidobacteria bacterium]|nr:hypothetical protein [Acidobacteriota bacterium]
MTGALTGAIWRISRICPRAPSWMLTARYNSSPPICRMIGNTLDTVRRDCRVVMSSHQNADPSKFDDREWLTSLYAFDGRMIYALVHNEYQGHTHRGQCPSGDYGKCWVNSVTFAKSTDGGRTYSHAPAPNHLVASAPYKYEPDTGPWGIFSPSNIIYN